MKDPFTTLSELANETTEPLYAPSGRLRKSSITRADVIGAFYHAFQMVGGTPRLAVWADQNPSDFFKLFGRLLPASSTTELDGPQEILVRHALPPPQTNPYRQVEEAPVRGPANNRSSVQATEDLRVLP